MPIPALLVCAAAVALLLVAEWRDSAPGRCLAKPIASSSFVWVGLEAGAVQSRYGQLVLAGLLLCWCGDILLIPTARKRWFQAGIAAFLLGHVAYVAAFVTRPLHPHVLLAAVCALALFGRAVLRWLGPHLTAEFRGPVRAYVATICTMAATALALTAAGGPAGVAAGAIAFVASDLSVARDRFVTQGFVNRLWGLPLYYVAQMLLAASVAHAR